MSKGDKRRPEDPQAIADGRERTFGKAPRSAGRTDVQRLLNPETIEDYAVSVDVTAMLFEDEEQRKRFAKVRPVIWDGGFIEGFAPHPLEPQVEHKDTVVDGKTYRTFSLLTATDLLAEQEAYNVKLRERLDAAMTVDVPRLKSILLPDDESYRPTQPTPSPEESNPYIENAKGICEIRAIQPKTCEHCKHWDQSKVMVNGKCLALSDGYFCDESFVPSADFGCSLWEAK